MNESGQVRIALIQMHSVFLDLRRNLETAAHRIREAAAEGAELVCLPEGFLTGYVGSRLAEAAELAETVDGPHISELSRLARELGVYLVVPFFEKTAGGVKNSVLLFDDAGRAVGRYSKTHLISAEKGIITPGDAFGVWDTPYGRIGCLICYDLCFPETARILARLGAQMILVPSAWGAEFYYRNWWDLNVACRALDNLVYVAAVNQVGTAGKSLFAGRTKVCGPTGDVIGQCSDDEEEILFSQIDMNRIGTERKRNTVHEDIRPELYASVLDVMRRE